VLKKLGKFEILRLVGHGSMGEVYIGRDPLIGREVAIKVIHAANTLGRDARERFAREARAAGVLNHPNIVTIHEMGEDQGVLYLAMELVKGETMDHLLAEGSLSPREVVEVLAQVCDGLAMAHRHQVLHRDIKPSNIKVVWDGQTLQAKILDFGVAKHINSDTTDEGTVFGTVNYMAPEYLQSGRPDARSDLFAVGVVLYEALTGAPPFDGPSPGAVIYRLLHEVPPPVPAERLDGLSKDAQAVLNRLLAKDPGNRFQTAEEVAKALRSVLDPNWHWEGEKATVALKRRPTPSDPIKGPRTPPKGLKKERFQAIPPIEVPKFPSGPSTVPKPNFSPKSPLPPEAQKALPLIHPPKELPKGATGPMKRVMPKNEPSLEVQADVLQETRRQLQKALDMAPMNPKTHALLLVTYYRLKAFDTFVEHMRKVMALQLPSQRLKETPRFQQLVEEEQRLCLLPFEVHAEFMSWAGG
jgi:serine/threonine protein kinase